jgi:hypothetical protein
MVLAPATGLIATSSPGWAISSHRVAHVAKLVRYVSVRESAASKGRNLALPGSGGKVTIGPAFGMGSIFAERGLANSWTFERASSW